MSVRFILGWSGPTYKRLHLFPHAGSLHSGHQHLSTKHRNKRFQTTPRLAYRGLLVFAHLGHDSPMFSAINFRQGLLDAINTLAINGTSIPREVDSIRKFSARDKYVHLKDVDRLTVHTAESLT